MSESAGEKTQAPTPKRKQKARDDGDLLKSREFGAALIILLGCGWMILMGPQLLGAIREVMAASFSFGRADIESFQPWKPLATAGWKLAPSLGALLAIALGGAVLSQAALGSLRFNGKLMAPKGNRINPGSGLKRIFGPTGWIELGKSLLKVVLLGGMGAWMLWGAARPTMGLVSSDLGTAVGGAGRHVCDFGPRHGGRAVADRGSRSADPDLPPHAAAQDEPSGSEGRIQGNRRLARGQGRASPAPA
ncbi:EscU/YscU/HrcU family type III secretion system export apparatus switch protein [Sphingomonas sp. J315]|uniref:EscU/YscU/HrcU family type III secretion system export apparatus switch protein n=1 Tax=Sphingomonas sp. J315 TaxID=2898433 RepID=UPI0039171FAF